MRQGILIHANITITFCLRVVILALPLLALGLASASQDPAIDAYLVQILELLKSQMPAGEEKLILDCLTDSVVPAGIPDYGIPPLDPFEVPHFTIPPVE